MADTVFSLQLPASIITQGPSTITQFLFQRFKHSRNVSRHVFVKTNINRLQLLKHPNVSKQSSTPVLASAISNSELSSPAYRTVSEVSAFLRSSNSTLLPDNFVCPQQLRAGITYNSTSNAKRLPLIDLSGALDPTKPEHEICWETAARQASEAAQDWGFFQVTNHGIPLELLGTIDSIGREFFNRTAEHKEKCRISFLRGYEGLYMVPGGGAPWVEALTLSSSPESNIVELAQMMHPQDHAMIRKIMHMATRQMKNLSLIILRLLAKGLGLDDDAFFSQHLEGEGNVVDIRWNYYPQCPDPSLALGYTPHTDPNSLTILYQDQIGGLQIQALDGTWFGVQPLHGALVINIGDTLMAWSNGNLKSALHRVVVNSVRERLSFGYFCSPPYELLLQPPTRIKNGDVPLCYRPFTFGAYKKYRFIDALHADPLVVQPINAFSRIH